MIRLHDTMSREKREFVPQDPKRITMYVCGPTVYGRAHIGNARPAVVFDLLRRVLEREYPEAEVVYARNVTDVDDKIIAAAEEEGVGYRVITSRFYDYYMQDMGALGVRPPSFEPRATAFIPQMISMIERLIGLGHAYEANGHVLFNVPSDPQYGQLSRRERDAILAGARVEVAPYKRDPADFVLWKPAGESAESVALSFPSPWGNGRPGWHIECSAMIEAFGSRQDAGNVETIDIHGGGLDLIFPHHENEIAQSRCVHGGTPLANYWVHNGFVDMGAEKMSKSLGNVITPEELLKSHKGETLRLALLSAHYRQPLPWTEALVSQAKATLDRWYRVLLELRTFVGAGETGEVDWHAVEALSDDLNTPAFLARLSAMSDHLWSLRNNYFHKKSDTVEFQGLAYQRDTFVNTARLVGLLTEDPDGWFRGDGDSEVDAKVQARATAKANRDFATADRIRDELKAEGIVLEDGPGGTTWRKE